MSAHTSAKHFECSVCGSVFEDICNLRLHMSVHTEEHSSKCNVCGKALKNRFNFWEHMRAHADEKTFRCKVCHKGFQDICTLSEHMRVHTTDKCFRCNVCNRTFIKKSSIYNHMRIHLDGKACKCNGSRFAFKEDPVPQSVVVSADDLFKCSVCHKAFNKRSYLREHIRIHTNEKPFKCSVCDAVFRRQSNLWQHMHIHSDEIHYRCKVCLETFHDKDSRESHMMVHKCKCNVCDKELMKTDLNAHMQLCFVNNACGYSECYRSFSNKETLYGHMKEHSKESLERLHPDARSEVSCTRQTFRSSLHEDSTRCYDKDSCVLKADKVVVPINNIATTSSKVNAKEILKSDKDVVSTSKVGLRPCRVLKSQKKTTVKADYNVNMSISKGKDVLKCSLCQKTFKGKRSLRQHMHDHSIEMPYRCRMCLEIFEDKGSWENHLRLKCKCTLCGKVSSNIDYNVHIRICPVNNPYKCNICRERFSDNEVFREHMMEHSKEESCKCKICGELIFSKYDALKHKELHSVGNAATYSHTYTSSEPTKVLGGDSVVHLAPSLCFIKAENESSEDIVHMKMERDNFADDFSNVIKEEEVFFSEDKKNFDREIVDTSNSFRSSDDTYLNNFMVMVDEQLDNSIDNNVADPLS